LFEPLRNLRPAAQAPALDATCNTSDAIENVSDTLILCEQEGRKRQEMADGKAANRSGSDRELNPQRYRAA
jgi:hypothetical protein